MKRKAGIYTFGKELMPIRNEQNYVDERSDFEGESR